MFGVFQTWDDMDYEDGREDGWNDYFLFEYRGGRSGSPYDDGYDKGWREAEYEDIYPGGFEE